MFTSDITAVIVTDDKVQKIRYCIHYQRKCLKKGKVKTSEFLGILPSSKEISLSFRVGKCTLIVCESQSAVGVREIAYFKIFLNWGSEEHDVMSLSTQQERGLVQSMSSIYRHHGEQLISHNLSFYTFHAIKRFAALMMVINTEEHYIPLRLPLMKRFGSIHCSGHNLKHTIV
uniref:Uncharacterized protein n=1 Tax=Glossina pallidipes TaxID=7398 RepID=A0A1A9ZIW1_GLOPL